MIYTNIMAHACDIVADDLNSQLELDNTVDPDCVRNAISVLVKASKEIERLEMELLVAKCMDNK